MKHYLFLLLSVLLLSVAAQASPVDEASTRKQVEQFLAGRTAAARGTAVNTAKDLQLATAVDGGYYIFNVGDNGGFVIVSADDRAPAILGYSDTGAVDAHDMPDNMRAWLQGYADEIKSMPEGAQAREMARQKRANTRSSIAPLLSCIWNQGSPYNNNCPIISGERAVTGCVATAMAQVMYYHKYPTAPTQAIPGYTPTDGSPAVSALPSTTFDWSKMYDSYANNEDGTEVAKLMQYCGASVEMSYGIQSTGGSGASTSLIPQRLVDYFGYDAGAKYALRSSYSYSEWIDLLYTELFNNRPVAMGGQSTGGGHAFVCDGYDEDDFFHINWGWGGSSNGFFRLSMLAPETQGAGGSSTSDGYNMSVGASIGVQPDQGSSAVIQSLRLTVTDISLSDEDGYVALTRMNNGNFQIYPTFSYRNYTGSTNSFKYGMRLMKGDEIIQEFSLNNGEFASISNNAGMSSGKTIQFGNGLADGTYKVIGISQNGADDWVACTGSDDNYVEAIISGNTLTTNVIKAEPKTVNLSVSNIVLGGTLKVGQSQTVTVTIVNSGNADFHGDITLAFIWTEGDSNYISKLGGVATDINAGSSKGLSISITPSRSGSFNLYIYNGLFNKGTALTYSPVTVYDGDSEANIDFSDLAVSNSSGDIIYGNAISGSVKAVNNGTNEYNQGLTLILYKTYNWEQTSSTGWSFSMSEVGAVNSNDVLAAGANKTLNFDFQGLEYGERYLLRAFYYTYANGEKTSHYERLGIFSIEHGFVTIEADGTVIASAPTASVTTPAKAIVVDLRGQSTVTSITPNSNPNCVYLLDEGAATPTGISTANNIIVKGNRAESVSIQDGYDFYTPVSFIADEVSYSRSFATGTDGVNGWSTIVLPFDVDEVLVGGEEKQWFQSDEDAGKHFWVKKFVSDGAGSVSFDYTDKIEANKPYIIAVPGDTWGAKWDLTGKQFTFKGENKNINSDNATTSGNNYKFTGTTKTVSLSAIYNLNSEGNSFDYVDTEESVPAFRAFFSTTSIAYSALRISSVDDQPTAIPFIVDKSYDKSDIYSLDGRKVGSDLKSLPKGVYIVNGKKIIK